MYYLLLYFMIYCYFSTKGKKEVWPCVQGSLIFLWAEGTLIGDRMLRECNLDLILCLYCGKEGQILKCSTEGMLNFLNIAQDSKYHVLFLKLSVSNAVKHTLRWNNRCQHDCEFFYFSTSIYFSLELMAWGGKWLDKWMVPWIMEWSERLFRYATCNCIS